MDHVPVLLARVLDALALRPGARVLDGTVGYGGHAEAILERTAPDGTLVGIDRDPRALDAARERLAPFGDRATLVRGRFGDVLDRERGSFDGILLDLGVSSPQLDVAERGFSFQLDGPVDMRMDPDAPVDASTWLEGVELDELTRVLKDLGEEPRARQIAKAILDGRPWTSTAALADRVARSSGYPRGRTHPATRTFQALRMVVNDELGELRSALDAGPERLAEGGRMAVISFHSLEDRMVKDAFRRLAGEGAREGCLRPSRRGAALRARRAQEHRRQGRGRAQPARPLGAVEDPGANEHSRSEGATMNARVDSRVAAVPLVALETTDVRDFEVVDLGRYALVALLTSMCMLLWAWSRIDLRETAVALDSTGRRNDLATAEHERLELELLSLKGKAWRDGESDGIGTALVTVAHP